MTYLVIKSFTDMQDNGYKYHTGDLFPRDGYEPNAERIEELLTDKNRRGMPMIKAKEEPKGEIKEDAPAPVKKDVEKTKKSTKPRKKTNVK